MNRCGYGAVVTLAKVDRRSRRGLHRLLIAGLALLVLTLAFGGWIAQSKAQERRQRSDAHAALTMYLQRVKHGDFRQAYGQLCSDVLYGYTEEDHARFLGSQPTYVSFDLGTPIESTGMDGTYLTFPVRLTHADGTTTMVRFAVGLQTDGPKVCDAADRRG